MGRKERGPKCKAGRFERREEVEERTGMKRLGVFANIGFNEKNVLRDQEEARWLTGQIKETKTNPDVTSWKILLPTELFLENFGPTL